MAQDSQSSSIVWTVTELAERFGPIPLDRVRHDPPAGSATERDLVDYFCAGVRQLWYVYPTARQVHVYNAPQQPVVLDEQRTPDGGDVLPGFNLSLSRLFAQPGADRK